MEEGAGRALEKTLPAGFREELRVSLGERRGVTVKESSVLLLLMEHNG